MLHDDELAAFQALLLDHLERGTDPELLQRALLEDPRAAPFSDYVRSFEPRCLEIAARIVQKWASRSQSPASSSTT